MKKLLLILTFLIGMIGSAQTPFQNYGDSLNGFNEVKVRNELALYHGVLGKEYFNTAPFLKRDFINQKYKLSKPQFLPSYSNKPIGGNNIINTAPCINEDFEATPLGAYTGPTNSTAISGWTISNQISNTCSPSNIWNAGSSKVWVLQTPVIGIPILGVLPQSPLGGNKVIQLHNSVTPYSQRTKISQTFPVLSSNTLFQFAYAGVWEDGGHLCCEQPKLEVRMFDCSGSPLSCSSLNLNAQGSNCPNGATGYLTNGNFSYTSWIVKYIDLTPYIGTCVTIEFINSDCIFTGHYGMVFLDAKCGGQLIGTGIPGPGSVIAGPVSFCAGSNQAMISAPLGYSSYQWYGPNGLISAPQGTQTSISITNPIPNSSYTVIMTASSGCSFTSIQTLTFTQVNIAGTNTTATCPGGASGTATVYGNGSGSGYNYNWVNSSNVTISTQSTAINLAAGIYTINISGLGAAGCGTAITTITIPSQPVPLATVLKPYCGNIALFQTNGGTNIHWYNNTILASTSSSYALNNPVNGNFVYLSYLSLQGCQDSIKYILTPALSGAVSILSNSLICPGGNNGSTVIGLTPAQGASSGFNSYSVTSIGATTPYTSIVNFSSLNTFTVFGLQAGGIYNANVFDGSCYYSTNFTVPQHIWNYTLYSNSYSLCPGQNTPAGINIAGQSSPSEYLYSWSPSTWLFANNTSLQTTIINPTISIGTQSTIIYTVIVTPTISGCSVTKTISITVFNPPTPTIFPIPNLCNTSIPYSINVSPLGGIFNSNSIISGVIQPNLSNIGVNAFTYSISVYTCISAQTSTYEVSQFRSSLLASNLSSICTSSFPINLMNLPQNTLGNWSGLGVLNNSFIPNSLNTGIYPLTYSINSTPNPTVCPSSTIMNVSVTKTISPSIVSIPEFCNNHSLINMTVSPSGGNWSGNAITVNGVVIPSLTTIPANTVNYSITVGPCVNTATYVLLTSNYNTASLTGIISNLCYNSPTINLMSIVQSTVSGNWSGSNVQNNNFNPSGLVTGIYTLTYNTTSSPNVQLCAESTIISVTVSNPPIPNIAQVGPFCNKNIPIQLNVLPNTGNWQSNFYLNSTGVFNPSLANIGGNSVTYIIGTPTCNTQQTKIINVEAFIPSTLIYQIPDLCSNNNPYNLSLLTLNNSGNWNGSGVIGNLFNPNIGAGAFTLTYNTSSYPSNLCPDHSTIAVNVYSLATPNITQVGPFCNSGIPIKINVTPIGGIFGGLNNNAINPAGIFVPAYGIIGNNIVSYSIASGPCVAYAQSTISIEKYITSNFIAQIRAFCKNSYPLNLNTTVENPGGVWSGSGIIGNMFNPSLANIGINRIHYQTHSNPSSLLCPDEDSVDIEVVDIPSLNITTNKKQGCAPLEVEFNILNYNTGYGIWYFNNSYKVENKFSTNYIYTKPGMYNVSFSYNNGVCNEVTSFVDSILVFESPKANFNIPSEIMISNEKTKIENLSTKLENNKYTWNISNIFYNEINPLINFSQVGNYKITLLATSINNCRDSISKYVNIFDEFILYIPNTFTPNNDELNDNFYPLIHFYKKYNMQIFNRWGELLYSAENGKWNGSYKGEIVKENVYIWKITIFKEDGSVIEKTGRVTLLK